MKIRRAPSGGIAATPKWAPRAVISGAIGAAGLLLIGSSAYAAPINSATHSAVCNGQSAASTDSSGKQIPADQIATVKKTLLAMCSDPNAGKSSSSSIHTDGTIVSGGAYVQAYIHSDPGNISIFGAANSIPYGKNKPKNELSCIYQEDHSGVWQGCGYGVGTTYIRTSSAQWCPAPGISIEAYVTLFSNGRRLGSDTAYAVTE